MEREETSAAAKRIRSSRTRHNILKNAEFATIEFLCKIMPRWIFPDLLTAVGLFGSLIIFASLILGMNNRHYLVIGVFGFAVQWFGDSLDGRLAYYRNTPRKWYGWSLDINADWISACIIGLGFYFYFPDYKIISFVFVVAYGGSMIVSLMRYKITNVYTIDAGIVGPTELRIIVSLFLLLEIFFAGALQLFGLVGSIFLIIINLVDSIKVMKMGDKRDAEDKIAKAQKAKTK